MHSSSKNQLQYNLKDKKSLGEKILNQYRVTISFLALGNAMLMARQVFNSQDSLQLNYLINKKHTFLGSHIVPYDNVSWQWNG